MIDFHPRKILGRWSTGYALDLHTTGSIYIGDDEFGHPQFETTRTPIGELLYRLKYRHDEEAVGEMVEAAETLIRKWNAQCDVIVPVPPSATRNFQPVFVLAAAIGKQLGVPVKHAVTKVRDVPQLKNIYDLDERLKLLEGLYAVDAAQTRGKRVLLFDDLYRSGATMNAITTVLYQDGGAADVKALTITRTRSNQ